ncbi:flavodoxin family protein [Nannocystaceae bacterium ST9]
MRALVVYESMFGNTQHVAEAIAEGLRERFEVELREVGHASEADLEGLDLLVVGGPIHAWSMTREGTRKGAHDQAEGAAIVSTGIGIREFLAQLHDANPDAPPAAATFDTAIRTRWFPVGSAAKPAARQLGKHGYSLIAKPEHFHVADTRGPLIEGELERARAWASELATRARKS